MRSTSAAVASSRRWSCSAQPVALRSPGLSVFVSILFHLVLIAVMAQPRCGKALWAFLLEEFIHQPVILGSIARDTVENKPAQAQGERPLPDFPQFVSSTCKIRGGIHYQ